MYKQPEKIILENDSVRLKPISIEDLDQLFTAASEDPANTFYHMFFGPFNSKTELSNWIMRETNNAAKITFSVYSKRLQKITGSCAIVNTDIKYGSSELGGIWYCKQAQRTEINSNAAYLQLCYLFDELKYRRVVWKCDNTNDASKAAAAKLGFKFEGLFRKHSIIKNRNRDTAWHSIIDDEWQDVKAALIKRIEEKEKLLSL
jgi:RimJ/RimL family protein N-acetyltransferase